MALPTESSQKVYWTASLSGDAAYVTLVIDVLEWKQDIPSMI